MVKIEKLIAQLKDGDWNVKTSAAQRLGEFKDAKAIDVLIDIIMKKSRYSSVVAYEMPRVLTRNPWGSNNVDEDLLDAASDSLVRIGSKALPLLMEKYGDMDTHAQDQSRYIIFRILSDFETMEEVHDFENNLQEGYNRLRTKHKHREDPIKVKTQIANFRMIIAIKKNKLVEDKGILLHGKPNPPKRGMYQQARRQTNG
jgi:hypothetical protein